MKIRHRQILLAWLILLYSAVAGADKTVGVRMTDISHSLVQVALQQGVTPEAAAQAMISKASELNLKLVGRQKIHEELRARGRQSSHLEVLQLCDPEDALEMASKNPIYAAYMPCRVAMVEDASKQVWLVTLNLDMIINSRMLAPDLAEIAIRINQNMLKVLVAGATGGL